MNTCFVVNRNTIRRMTEEPPMIMGLQTTATLPCVPQMAMSRHMAMAHIQGSPAMATTTMDIWLMTEDMQHQGIPIFKKVPKRREIETTNHLEISTQVSLVLYRYTKYN